MRSAARAPRRIGAALVSTVLLAPTARAATERVPQPNAVAVPVGYRYLVGALAKQTQAPIVVPHDDRWAGDLRESRLVACPASALDETTYSYTVFRGDATDCGTDSYANDPMFQYAFVTAAPATGPYEAVGRIVPLGRGIQGDATSSSGFDDTTSPFDASVAWRVGTTSYDVDVRFGDAVALARSIVANLAVAGPAQGLAYAAPRAPLAARTVAPALADGVASLRRRTSLPIEIPTAPAIGSEVHLFPHYRDRDRYTYFLCATIACSDASHSAEINASRDDEVQTTTADSLDLGCRIRGSISYQPSSDTSRPKTASTVEWQQGSSAFEIFAGFEADARTDIVAIARSMIANACGSRVLSQTHDRR